MCCLAALLHDASEAYIADVSRPLKRQKEMQPYRRAETLLEAVIAEKYGFADLSLEGRAIIKKADSVMLMTEARDLMQLPSEKWAVTEAPIELEEGDVLGNLDPSTVESRFLSLLDVLAEELTTGEQT